jgi:hypothetical protein
MQASDARFVLLIATTILARIVGVPAIALGGAITVSGWHGFELGREMNGWNPANNLATLFMLGFFAFVMGVLWVMMRRDERKGKVPVLPPAYFLTLLLGVGLGFVVGAVSRMVTI